MNKRYRTFTSKNLPHYASQFVDKILNTVNTCDPSFEIISISNISAGNNELIITTIILKTSYTGQV